MDILPIKEYDRFKAYFFLSQITNVYKNAHQNHRRTELVHLQTAAEAWSDVPNSPGYFRGTSFEPLVDLRLLLVHAWHRRPQQIN